MAKKIMKEFVMTEISTVDRPAQKPAKMTIMKRDVSEESKTIAKSLVTKYYVANQAQDFKTSLMEHAKMKAYYEAYDDLYCLIDPLKDTLAAILSDPALSEVGKEEKLSLAVNDFLEAVKVQIPDIAEDVAEVFEEMAGSSGDINPDEGASMSEELKKVADLEKALAEKTAELEKAEKSLADMKAAEEKKKKKDEMAKNDETIVVAGQTIAKSEVGEGQFAIFKAQAEQIAKAEERIAKAEEAAEFARLEKRAADEFKHLPGSSSDHAKMLKAIDGLSDTEVAKAFEGLMKAHDLAKAEAFKSVGFSKSADEAVTFDAKVNEIQKRDNISKSRAMELAAQEHPELVEAIR